MDESTPMIPKAVEMQPNPGSKQRQVRSRGTDAAAVGAGAGAGAAYSAAASTAADTGCGLYGAAPSPLRAHPSDLADHDGDDTASSASSRSSYEDESTNDLGVLSGAALITADCLGTGILALPADIKVLGAAFGLSFLVLNLPINLYAGTILSQAASFVEGRLAETPAAHHTEVVQHDVSGVTDAAAATAGDEEAGGGKDDGTRNKSVNKKSGYSSLGTDARQTPGGPEEANVVREDFDYEDEDADAATEEVTKSSEEGPADGRDDPPSERQRRRHGHSVHRHAEVHTYDFIGMTTALFEHAPTCPDSRPASRRTATHLVKAAYYTNIFLVLGNYILVMSHAVAAMVGEDRICLPTAGIVASVLMYALSQIRTMADLGRSASIISLTALFIVVAQCLYSIERGDEGFEPSLTEDDFSVMRKLSALSSIGFAVGSQKLLLNIRHEMADRAKTPRSLGLSLGVFGAAYVGVCLLAGPNPPPFLFDAVGAGPKRRAAGFLLWVHVAVSFAINSQALTSSLDRVRFHRVTAFKLHERHCLRWAVLTLMIAGSSYFVANAIPFFKDLVALIGALTSVPLTLLFPAIFHRRVLRVPIFRLVSAERRDLASYLLLAFALAFMACGMVGVLDSIEMDWSRNGAPFACH